MAEKGQKQKDILASAKVLFREKGFHNTKMDEIAQNAGVGKGTLYGYFKNKQEIFDETCVESIKLLRKHIEDISKKDIVFKDKIIQLFKEGQNSIDAEYEKNPIDYIMSYKNIISEKVLITMFEQILDINKSIVKIIEQGKYEGVVKKDIPSEIIACSIVGTIGEYYNLKRYKKDYELYEEDIIYNLLFSGFGMP